MLPLCTIFLVELTNVQVSWSMQSRLPAEKADEHGSIRFSGGVGYSDLLHPIRT
jgi:hypothetical protein